jgi:hypothetical protein
VASRNHQRESPSKARPKGRPRGRQRRGNCGHQEEPHRGASQPRAATGGAPPLRLRAVGKIDPVRAPTPGTLVRAQRRHGVYARRPPGREIAGDGRDRGYGKHRGSVDCDGPLPSAVPFTRVKLVARWHLRVAVMPSLVKMSSRYRRALAPTCRGHTLRAAVVSFPSGLVRAHCKRHVMWLQ